MDKLQGLVSSATEFLQEHPEVGEAVQQGVKYVSEHQEEIIAGIGKVVADAQAGGGAGSSEGGDAESSKGEEKSKESSSDE